MFGKQREAPDMPIVRDRANCGFHKNARRHSPSTQSSGTWSSGGETARGAGAAGRMGLADAAQRLNP